MICGAIFDLDGVLLDSMGVWHDLGSRYLHSIDVQPESGLNEVLFSMSIEQGAAYLKRTYRLPQSEKEIQDGIGSMLQNFYYHDVMLKTGAKELVDFLRGQGISIAAATSSPRSHVIRALERNGLLAAFSVVLTTGELGESKHNPLIYLRAADMLGCVPEETLVFEDSLYALKTAAAAGFYPVAVYDKQGEPDQAGLKQAGRLYLRTLKDFIPQWNRI